MMHTFVDDSWSARDLAITIIVLTMVTFWVIRKRSFRDLLALVLAATVLVAVIGIGLFLLRPRDGEWVPLAVVEALLWVAVLIGWTFNKLFRTGATSDVKDKDTKPISSDEPMN